jgi:hypothetical protein
MRRHTSNTLDISEFFLFSSPNEPCCPDRLTNTYGPFCFELEASEHVDLFKLQSGSEAQYSSIQ